VILIVFGYKEIEVGDVDESGIEPPSEQVRRQSMEEEVADDMMAVYAKGAGVTFSQFHDPYRVYVLLLGRLRTLG